MTARLLRPHAGGILTGVNRTGLASWDRQDLEDQRRRIRTVSLEDRLHEAIAWSAALLADALKHGRARAVDPPDPVGLGTRRT